MLGAALSTVGMCWAGHGTVPRGGALNQRTGQLIGKGSSCVVSIDVHYKRKKIIFGLKFFIFLKF